MYNRIRKLKPCIELYSDKLVSEGVVTKEEAKVGPEGEGNSPMSRGNPVIVHVEKLCCILFFSVLSL